MVHTVTVLSLDIAGWGGSAVQQGLHHKDRSMCKEMGWRQCIVNKQTYSLKGAWGGGGWDAARCGRRTGHHHHNRETTVYVMQSTQP